MFLKSCKTDIWSEWVETVDHLQYLILPRLAAVAEASWTPQEKRSYENFEKRIQGEKYFYQLMEVDYGKHVFK